MMDDTFIHGCSTVEHHARLERVLTLQDARMTLNLQKYQFSQAHVKFLGQRVNKIGVRPYPHKVQAIQEVQQPRTVSDVRRFLEMCNHLSKMFLVT